DDETRESKKKIEDGLRQTFRPEFLNRIDEIIIFHPLTLEHMIQIVDLQMKEIRERLEERGITVELTDAAREWLAQKGYDPAFGARPLRRTLQRYLESPLSKRILQGEFLAGEHILADVGDDDNLAFAKQEPIPAEVLSPAQEVEPVEV
ncbi:MAG: ATP-dependent Clp protease ATP-binding subunit, partial [Anaerolineae bacterium]